MEGTRVQEMVKRFAAAGRHSGKERGGVVKGGPWQPVPSRPRLGTWEKRWSCVGESGVQFYRTHVQRCDAEKGGGLSAQTRAHRANIRFKEKKEKRKKNPFYIQRGFDEQCATKVLAFPLRKSLSKASLGGGGGYWTTPSACGLGCMRRLLALAGGGDGCSTLRT